MALSVFEGRLAHLACDDFILLLLPVVVGLFKRLDLRQNLSFIDDATKETTSGTGQCQRRGMRWKLTSVSVQALILSRRRLKRICSAGTW